MSVQFARNAAEKLLERFPDFNRAPVNVESLARQLGLKVVLDDLGEDVSGLLVLNAHAGPSIAVHSAHSKTRQRFTIAHEIGHFVLRHQFKGELVHVDGGRQVLPRSSQVLAKLDPREAEANQFAASLLMPVRLVREQVRRLGTPIVDEEVAELASTFRVSEQAMTIRLSTLGFA